MGLPRQLIRQIIAEEHKEPCEECNDSIFTDEYKREVRLSRCYKCGL